MIRRRHSGFSLLEMLVAVTILGLALGALYQAVGGATRNVRADQRYAYAVELARSILADSSEVPLTGYANSGETASGFRWDVEARPIARPRGSRTGNGALQQVQVEVSWVDGARSRRVRLDSVVPGVRQ